MPFPSLKLECYFQGRTPRSLPAGPYPDGWYVTNTDTHYQTRHTIVPYMQNIIIPYFNKRREELGYDSTQKAILVMDVHTTHTMDEVLYRAVYF